jgi:hypothetical protein
MYCNRTGIYFVLKDPDDVTNRFKGKDAAKNMVAFELSGYAQTGVLVYDITRELPPITDWRAFDRAHNMSEETYNEVFDRDFSMRLLPR